MSAHKPLAFRSVRGYITEHGVEVYTQTEMWGQIMRDAVYYNGHVITFAKNKAVAVEFLHNFVKNSFNVSEIEPLKGPNFDLEVKDDAADTA